MTVRISHIVSKKSSVYIEQAASVISKVTKQQSWGTVSALMVHRSTVMGSNRRPAHPTLIWARKGLKVRDNAGNVPEPEQGSTRDDSPYMGMSWKTHLLVLALGPMQGEPILGRTDGMKWLETLM